MTSAGFERSYATGHVADFQARVADNLIRLAAETGQQEFAVPVAIFLVVDEKNGGDQTAQEIVKRFGLLDVESRNVIDFFFLGWNKQPDGALAFSLEAFSECREALRNAGVTGFGGNADLYVLDAWYRQDKVDLDFTRAIHLDMAEAAAKGTIERVGSFLQGLMAAAEGVRSAGTAPGVVFQISDRLGLASAKQSLLDYLLGKWGELIGAKKLAQIAIRPVGRVVDLSRL